MARKTSNTKTDGHITHKTQVGSHAKSTDGTYNITCQVNDILDIACKINGTKNITYSIGQGITC